ncbi:MAG TPA: ribosome rescue protein RqcH [Candidatus Acidoferrales bacterium]|nr:ribosome rescue protein RqcH [Candidatus Acidoferrales bacterium]
MTEEKRVKEARLKTVMTSVDVAALVPELQVLVGAKFEKAYQLTPVELRLRFVTAQGKRDLLIEAGKRLHLTSTPFAAPVTPPSFPMLLRKELRGGKISSVTQYDFDRVIEIQLTRETDQRYLICELFSKGNIILADESRRIILPLRVVRSAARQIIRGQCYEYPVTQLSPAGLPYDEFEAVITSTSREVVRTLATRLNLGGLYAEEVCFRAGVTKNITSLNPDEIRRLYAALQAVFEPVRSNNFKPHIVCDDESNPIDVVPFELSLYSLHKKHCLTSFGQALDVYYERTIERPEATPAAYGRFDKIIERQRAAIEQFKNLERENRRKGELLFERYQELDRLIRSVREARLSRTWSEVADVLGTFAFVQQVDQSTGTITIEVDSVVIDLTVAADVPQNAQRYYDKAKVAKAKAEGAQRALAQTLKKAEREKETDLRSRAPEKKPFKKRKTRWYERYRWFFSSEGFLVIGGRDADTNEELVKKYLEPRDLFLHADVHGAPVVIVKSQGKEIPERTIREAAEFAVSYSSIWKEGLASGRCYWVYPNQVSKTPESGEYVPKGAFVIRGERHYLESQARLAVGLSDDRIIGGPESAITRVARPFVVIEPGKYNSNDLAKMISRQLLATAADDQRKGMRRIITIDQIMKFLPIGNSALVSV